MEILIFVVATLVVIGLERLPGTRFRELPVLRRNVATDALCLATGVLALGFLMRGEAARWVGTQGVATHLWTALPSLGRVGLAIVLYDAAAYGTHVLLHRSSRLWALHQVHHSSPELDWLATHRAHLVEHALRHLASPVLLILLGFSLPTVVLAAAVYGACASLGHANVRLPLRWAEAVLITPRLHRIHHVTTSSENNFGTIFSVWDRLFGTLCAAPETPLAPLGVPGGRENYPQTWFALQREPFRSCPDSEVVRHFRRGIDVPDEERRRRNIGNLSSRRDAVRGVEGRRT